MDFQAIGIIQPTIDKVKSLLLPLEIGKWMKLALIVLIAGASSGGGGGYIENIGNLGDWQGLGDEDTSGEEIDPSIDEWFTGELILAIFAAILLLFLLWLFWGYISSVFTFIFLEAAITKKIEIVSGFKRNARRGLAFFLFKLGAGVVFLFLITVVISLFVLGAVVGDETSLAVTIVAYVFLIVFATLLLISASIIFSMAEDFAAPMMYMRGQGIISGIRHSLSLFKKDFWQFIMYYVMKIAFGVAAGIISLIALIPLVLVMGVGIAILVLLWAAMGISLQWDTMLIAIAIIPIIILGVFVFVYLSILITLPIPVFFRYYSLLFLRKMDGNLDFERGVP